MSDNTRGRRVREPVQAWLDQPDAALLGDLAARLQESKAEVIRRAIRLLAQETELTHRPGAGLGALAGALDAAKVPTDLALNHDAYLYGDQVRRTAKARRR
jgi:Ribbon-helix-helix protein, copG family